MQLLLYLNCLLMLVLAFKSILIYWWKYLTMIISNIFLYKILCECAYPSDLRLEGISYLSFLPHRLQLGSVLFIPTEACIKFKHFFFLIYDIFWYLVLMWSLFVFFYKLNNSQSILLYFDWGSLFYLFS